MNPAKSRERKCSTCKHYQPSPLWRKGWCRNPLLYDRNTNHLVEADSLACNRTFIDYWEPMTGPMPSAGPQARSPKPRIAPSIPMDTMDAQGKRSTVTGNTPAAGMAAIVPKQKRTDEIPDRPALSIVTADFDEVFGENDENATLQLEEVAKPGSAKQGTAGSQAVRKTQPKKGLAGMWANSRSRMMLILGALAVVLLLAGGTWFMSRNNGKPSAGVTPTVTIALVVPTPTGFGDPTATVPAVATQPPAPPPNTIAINGWVQVTGTGSGLVIRNSPGKSGKRQTVVPDGTKMHVVDGPQDADGFTWWKVDQYNSKDPSASGWCAAQVLTPLPAPAP